MNTTLKTVIAATTLVAGIAAVQTLYADSTGNAPGASAAPVTQGKMMGQGQMTSGQGNMMGMMQMMEHMREMMKDHGKSMQTMMDPAAHDVKRPAQE